MALHNTINGRLEVAVKQVYGQRMVYPVNDNAKKMCELLGTKTFTQSHIDKLKDMGYWFETEKEEV